MKQWCPLYVFLYSYDSPKGTSLHVFFSIAWHYFAVFDKKDIRVSQTQLTNSNSCISWTNQHIYKNKTEIMEMIICTFCTWFKIPDGYKHSIYGLISWFLLSKVFTKCGNSGSWPLVQFSYYSLNSMWYSTKMNIKQLKIWSQNMQHS